MAMSLPRPIPRQTNRKMINLTAKPEVARSPKESPPTIKKRFCRLMTSSTSAAEGLVPAPKSILKKSRRNTAGLRHVGFNPHVNVVLLSEEGDFVCSQCDKLRTEESVYKSLPRTPKPGFYNQNYNNLMPFMGFHNEKLHQEANDIVQASQVDFVFVEEEGKGTVLKFVLHLGLDYKPDDIVVKANVGGNRIRLVATKPVSYRDGSIRIEHLSKRFLLPVEVDPYVVTARLDVRGNLTVEAPLQKSSTKPTKEVLSPGIPLKDISNVSA